MRVSSRSAALRCASSSGRPAPETGPGSRRWWDLFFLLSFQPKKPRAPSAPVTAWAFPPSPPSPLVPALSHTSSSNFPV